MRAIGNKRSVCNLIRAAAFAATLFAVPGGAARAADDCEYPSVAFAMFVKPENQVGEFRIVFNPPDYRDAAAVRNHFVFATVWARMLDAELAARSKRRCSAVMTPHGYPNLHAYLIIDPRGVGVDRSICARMLQDIVVSSRPSAAAVLKNAAEAAHWKEQWRSHASADPDNLLIAALTHIYRPGTVMHSLYAVGPRSFRSLDARAFRAWLEDQWESGRRIEMRPAELCPLEGGPQAMRARAPRLPYSSLIPPGIVRIPANDGVLGPNNLLRHGVAVGHRGVLDGWRFPLVAVTKGKYCGRDLTLPGDGERGASLPALVRIFCATSVSYDNDAWTLFFCEDCPSEQAVEAAMTMIANDPDIIALGLSYAVNGQPRGPYRVTIEAVTEQ